MRVLALLLITSGVACAAFAYWGLHTVSGRSAFDEMAGMVPLGAGVLGGFCLVGGLVMWWLKLRKKK